MTANASWVWLLEDVVVAVHEEHLAEHGGAMGMRDAGLMASALARPRQLAAQGTPDHAGLAAAYGFGFARNRPFVDGNERAAFVAVELFLALNGWTLNATDADGVLTTMALAAGDLSEAEFAGWIRTHSEAR